MPELSALKNGGVYEKIILVIYSLVAFCLWIKN